MADYNNHHCNDNCNDNCDHPCDTNFREAVCIHTDKVYDSCRDKDYATYIHYVIANKEYIS